MLFNLKLFSGLYLLYVHDGQFKSFNLIVLSYKYFIFFLFNNFVNVTNKNYTKFTIDLKKKRKINTLIYRIYKRKK